MYTRIETNNISLMMGTSSYALSARVLAAYLLLVPPITTSALNDRRLSSQETNIFLPSNDALLDERHAKFPYNLDAFPLDDPFLPCLPVNNTYGVSSNDPIDILYKYEIIFTSQGDEESLETEIIPAVEESIANSLLGSYIPGCNISKRRRTATEKRETVLTSNVHHRKLAIVGFTSSPSDELSDKRCTSEIQDDSFDCASVIGGLSFYLTDDANAVDRTKIVGQVLTIIKEGMENDEYLDAHPDIIEIIFMTDILSIDVDQINGPLNLTTRVTGQPPEEIGGLPVVAISIASLSLFLFFGTVGLTRRYYVKSGDEDSDEEDDEEEG